MSLVHSLAVPSSYKDQQYQVTPSCHYLPLNQQTYSIYYSYYLFINREIKANLSMNYPQLLRYMLAISPFTPPKNNCMNFFQKLAKSNVL